MWLNYTSNSISINCYFKGTVSTKKDPVSLFNLLISWRKWNFNQHQCRSSKRPLCTNVTQLKERRLLPKKWYSREVQKLLPIFWEGNKEQVCDLRDSFSLYDALLVCTTKQLSVFKLLCTNTSLRLNCSCKFASYCFDQTFNWKMYIFYQMLNTTYFYTYIWTFFAVNFNSCLLFIFCIIVKFIIIICAIINF